MKERERKKERKREKERERERKKERKRKRERERKRRGSFCQHSIDNLCLRELVVTTEIISYLT